MKKLLVVVDMQNDFVTGPLGTPEAQAIVPAVLEKVKAEHRAGRGVLFTKDQHFENSYPNTQEGKKLPVLHCLFGTKGYELVPELEAEVRAYDSSVSPDYIIHKHAFGAYPDSIQYVLDDGFMNDVEEIEVCGVCTDICVISNVAILRTMLEEATITVDSKAVAGTTPEASEVALTVMRSLQVSII